METMKEWLKELKIKASPRSRRAGAYLEERGKKFLIDFGYENAEAKARELYDLNLAPLSIKTLNGMVLHVLRLGGWWTPWQIQPNVRCMVSDSSITARLRDLRKPQYGAHKIEKRKREGSRAFEYRLRRAA
jgi:hypothetical protein